MVKVDALEIATGTRTAVLIDNNSTRAMASRLDNLKVDFAKMQTLFDLNIGKGKYTATIFATVDPDPNEYSSIVNTLTWASNHGYNVITRPCRVYVRVHDQKRALAGSMFADVAVEMIKLAHSKTIDTIVLVSDPSDLVSAIRYVKAMGITVIGAYTQELDPKLDEEFDDTVLWDHYREAIALVRNLAPEHPPANVKPVTAMAQALGPKIIEQAAQAMAAPKPVAAKPAPPPKLATTPVALKKNPSVSQPVIDPVRELLGDDYTSSMQSGDGATVVSRSFRSSTNGIGVSGNVRQTAFARQLSDARLAQTFDNHSDTRLSLARR